MRRFELAGNSLKVFSFQFNEEDILFKAPIILEILENDGYYYLEIAELDIFVYSEENRYDVAEFLLEELENKYNWLVLSPENILTDRAKDISNRFISMLE